MYYLTSDQYHALCRDGLAITAAAGQPITLTGSDEEAQAAAIAAVGAMAAHNSTDTESVADAMLAATRSRNRTDSGIELTNVVLAAGRVVPETIHGWPDYANGNDNRGNYAVLGSLDKIAAAVRANDENGYTKAVQAAVDDGATNEQIVDAYRWASAARPPSFNRISALPAPSRPWITVRGYELTPGDRIGWPYFDDRHRTIAAISGPAGAEALAGNRIAVTEDNHVVPICRQHRYGIEPNQDELREHAGY